MSTNVCAIAVLVASRSSCRTQEQMLLEQKQSVLWLRRKWSATALQLTLQRCLSILRCFDAYCGREEA